VAGAVVDTVPRWFGWFIGTRRPGSPLPPNFSVRGSIPTPTPTASGAGTPHPASSASGRSRTAPPSSGAASRRPASCSGRTFGSGRRCSWIGWTISDISGHGSSPARRRTRSSRTRNSLAPGLRFRVSAGDGRALATEVLRGASWRLGRRLERLRELGPASVLALPPEEQYLVAAGRVYFRDLGFHELRRLQFDLETTGLDPRRARIFTGRPPASRATPT
jgi:hypothetical protein